MKWTDIFQTELEINQSVLAKAKGMPSGNAIFEKLFLSGAALGSADKTKARSQSPLLTLQAQSWDEGVRFYDSDLFFPFFH